MRIVMAGASGFLGTALGDRFRADGHDVVRLVRRSVRAADESQWDPYADEIDAAVVTGADLVVNLAGSATLGNPHSKKWRRRLEESRVFTTRLLAETIAAAEVKPAFLAGNGISYYGDHGADVLTEASDSRGHGLLTEVARAWQAAAAPAVAAGARVCVLRTAPVMDRANAPLRQLRPLFLAGLGGRIGHGRQYLPMVSRRDWVGAANHLANDTSASGPFNICCPHTPTNAEFTRSLAKAVRRPTFAVMPGPVVRLAAGPMAPEVLGSINARPAALEAAGYRFADPGVDEVLATGLA
jgi:uncharacterized protein (TIGR01777 family)